VLRITSIRYAIFTILLLLFVPSLCAHESRPAYLEVKETASGQYSLLWRIPTLSGMRLPVMLQLPDDVRNLKQPDESRGPRSGSHACIALRPAWGDLPAPDIVRASRRMVVRAEA
jgi:hypothetical protein